MKLRILDDSIRLRLTRSEVATFADSGGIRATTGISGGPLEYEVLAGAAFGAEFSNGLLTVTVPASEVAQWAGDETPVGIYGETGVSIAVEKDFQTFVPRRGIDPEDYYPNPKQPRQ